MHVLRNLVLDIASWIRAAEGSAYTAELRAPRLWRAELAVVKRELEVLKRRVEKIASEIDD